MKGDRQTQTGEILNGKLQTENQQAVLLILPRSLSIGTTIPVGKIWKYAGYLRRSLTTGLGASFVGEPESLFLGKFNLIVFNNLNINYFLSLQVPK